jgi:tRNA(Ile)-lysidine synthase
MLEKLKNAIKSHSMIKKGDKVLLCVSGGPDSVAMLYVFLFLAKEMQLRLFIAHLNHSLRGVESDKDQRYVEKIAGFLNIPVICEKKDTFKLSRDEKISLEAAARKLRYDFFMNTADKLGIKIIATAHTKDDQAETVLMRLIRGTGPRGLCGIPIISYIRGVKIIRPLIDVSRQEVLKYLAYKKLRPRADKSNADIRFFRNRVRLKFIPFIEKEYNPDIKKTFSNLAELMQGDYEYLEYHHNKAFKKLAGIRRNNTVIFKLSDIRKEHLSVRRGLIRKAIEFLCDSLDNIEYRHWKEIESLIYKRPANTKVNLPNQVVIEKGERSIRFSIYKTSIPEKACRPVRIFKIPSSMYFGKYRFSIKMAKAIHDFSKKPKHTEYIDIKESDFPLVLRTFKKGDRIKPLGMSGCKKVSDIFIDDKIPLRRRKCIPILVSSQGEVLCIFGVRVSETCKIQKGSKKSVKLELLTRYH